MSSRAEHYREAERLLADTLDPTCVWEAGARERMIAAAHVRAQEKLAHDTKVFVDRCVAAEIPVRDIAFLTGLTPQRISQISRS